MSGGLRVLHVVRGLANSSGTTHIVIPLAEAQARLGCRVSIFHVAKPGRESLSPDPAKVESRLLPMTAGPDNPGFSLPFATLVGSRIREFDVVHVHAVWNFPTWWTMRTARRAGVPYMAAPQGSFDPWAAGRNRGRKLLYGLLGERRYLQEADRLQALTVKEAEQFRRAGLRPEAVVLPNGVEPERFRGRGEPLYRALGLPEGERTLLHLSRIHPKKGLDTLLHAFRAVREGRRVTLVVAGSDGGSGYLDRMKDLARDLGVAGHCRFLGEVAGEEKLRALRGADAFALLSQSEGLPVAALEAMAAGLPSVISSECNLPEAEAAAAAWVVPPEASAAAAALARVLDDPVEAARRGENARRLVSGSFSWEGIARRSLPVYESMIVGARARRGG